MRITCGREARCQSAPIPDFDAAGDPGDDGPPQPGEHPPSDEELCGLIFDPDSSPPDGAEAWLADLPDPVRNAYLDSVAAQSPPAAPEAIAAGFLHRDGGRGRGFAAGGLLDVMEPGAVLAGFADDAWADGLDRLTDDELVGVLCAWRRLASWSAAGEIAAVSTLARRRAAESAGAGQQRLADHVDGEIAAALTLTGRSADRLLELAAGLARLPGTSAALAAGQIDWPRAIVITDEVASLGRAEAAAVEARILGDAPGQTTGSCGPGCAAQYWRSTRMRRSGGVRRRRKMPASRPGPSPRGRRRWPGETCHPLM